METLPNAAPIVSTESAGALTQVVKDKKKKKKKLTPKERALERLEKAAEKILEDSEKFNDLIVTVSYWLKNKENISQKLFDFQYVQTLEHEAFLESVKKKEEEEKEKKDIDEFTIGAPAVEPPPPEQTEIILNEDPKISYDDFKLVVTDLDIPCTNIQLHALCKILDPNSTKKIIFKTFTCDFLNTLIRRHQIDGIRFITRTEQTKFLNNITFKRELTKYFASSSPCYIKLDLKHITFANEKEFRGHVKEEIVNTKTKIYSLIELLKDKLDIVSYKISIYQDVSKSKNSYLDENRTLESYGYTGGAYNDVLESNEKVVLYFDYWILRNEDPILNCDFYFNSYKLIKK